MTVDGQVQTGAQKVKELRDNTHSQLPLYPPYQSCPAGATVWPWLGIWDGGIVSVPTLVLWDNLRRICGNAAVISTGWGYWGWQTEPDWIAGHFPPDARCLWCLLFFCSLTVGPSLHVCLSHITLADHPYKKKCPARFKFSQECGPSEHPLSPSGPFSTWELLQRL